MAKHQPTTPTREPGITRKRTLALLTLAGLIAAASVAYAQGSMYGDLALRPGFRPDPVVLRGQSGGHINAQQVNRQCLGWISPNPNHLVRIDQPMRWMRMFIQSSVDTTLVVQTPQGSVLCNDDTYGLNPAVEQYWAPGVYRVWVGSYSQGQAGQYTLTFTEIPSVQPGSQGGGAQMGGQGGTYDGSSGGPSAAPYVPPQQGGGQPPNPMTLGVGPQTQPQGGPGPQTQPQGGGTLDVNATQGNSSPGWIETRLRPDPQVLEGRAGGPVQATRAAGSSCRGWVQSTPDHIIYVQGRARYLRLYTEGRADLTMVIRTPDGRYLCDDDGGQGTNPQLAQERWEAGEYRVWIGTYGRTAPGSTPYRLMITREQPAGAI